MNNEKELIKQIIDQKPFKQQNNSISLNQSASAKMINLIDKKNRNQLHKDNINLNHKGSNTRNNLLSQREKRQKYSEDIKQSIENERRANMFNKPERGSTPKAPSSSATFYRNEKRRKYNANNHLDYFNSKYERHNIQQIAYQIEKEFSKVNTTKESFNERMEFYVAKQKIKEEKINELIALARPHIEEKDKIETFNRLIQDANRRTEVKKCLENINSDMLIMNMIRNNQQQRSTSVKMTHEEWEKIYKDRFIAKLTDRNEKVKKEIQLRKQKLEEEEKNFDEEMLKRRKVVSKQELLSIANRLYNKNYRDVIKKTKEYSTNSHTSPTLKNSHSNKMYIIKKEYKFNDLALNQNEDGGKAINNDNGNNNAINSNSGHLDMNIISTNKAEKIIDNFFLN